MRRNFKSKIHSTGAQDKIFRLPSLAESAARPKRLRLRVAGVMAFDAAREQTFASALAAPGERGTAGLCLHARAEAVLTFARAFGRLIGAFHKAE